MTNKNKKIMYTEEQLKKAFFAGEKYAHAARNGQPTLGLRFNEWKECLVKELDYTDDSFLQQEAREAIIAEENG